ncbi:MAG: tetratricopeptide repeat protein [Thermoguttaceae bacterium]|nr:tetratricopeptide repeat protein [Thermoguttaceae bacterium]MDW8039165.1 tetratricopeptide repeat protein [Thermoguttaceae bacterium]
MGIWRLWLLGQWMLIASSVWMDLGRAEYLAAPSGGGSGTASQLPDQGTREVFQPEAPETSGPDDSQPSGQKTFSGHDQLEQNSSSDPGADPTVPTAGSQKPSTSGSLQGAKEPPVEPMPEPQWTERVVPEPASFNGITPGQSTQQKLQSLWGKPKEVRRRGEIEVYMYSIEPFQRIEVALANQKVSSIIIWLEEAFPANQVAQQLDLARIQPVFISNELGEILGQGYPERGVIFGFEPAKQPGKTSQKVIQIILEPIGPELFLLRAETYVDTHPSRALADLEQVLRLAPNHARAYWLQAKVCAALGQMTKALESSSKAVRLDPGDGQYRLTYGQVLSELGRWEEARTQAQQALELSQRRPHVKAQALCLLGDLVSGGPKPDWKQALDYYAEAIKTAEPLGSSAHPAVRLAAKNALVEAHLGAAYAIAWGLFRQKEVAVPKWLDRAWAFAEEIIANEGGTEAYRFHVACRALNAYVGLQGKLDPTAWAEKALQSGQQGLRSAEDPQLKDQIAWKLGTALYDALQVYQFRGDSSKAVEYGELARQTLQQCSPQRQQTFAYNYLLGRVYFRLGAIHAVGRQDHQAAIRWYEKAVPLLSLPVPEEGFSELARHGETFVSMGVSYWEVGQRDRALDLTQRGLALMEQAVRSGLADRSILAVPYGNLAFMHQALGRSSEARRYAELAAQSKSTAQR